MTASPADAAIGNWVERFAPDYAKPYLRLMRADRPIGTWLLLLPCWWGQALAAPATDINAGAIFNYAFLFAVGAIVMRGAGCAYNDIIDRDFDAKVERTALRPIPSGQIAVRSAWIFLLVLCLLGLSVLIQFNPFTIALGLSSLGLVAVYPFMKRITWWPQAWLGLTFNWGVLMGYSALAGKFSLSAILLYMAGIAWTLGYDTIYAHQDKEDDALIGVKSSARALGAKTKGAVRIFYAASIALAAAASLVAGFHPLMLLFLAAPGAQLIWQTRKIDIDDPAACLTIFKSNREAGLLVLAALLLGGLISRT
jgi:4-hydroxybenzoate polyprenyltransferase